MKVLFVEDSELLQDSVCTGLRRLGFAVDSARDGEEGLWLAESNGYDVVILDIMLPKMDGLTLLKKLREKGSNDHVLILTARDAVPDRVAGLDCGADDYLPKPFEFDELVARVRALARRAYQQKSPILRLPGGIEIDTIHKNVTCAEKQLPHPLTAREYVLLELLAMNAGKVVSRTEIEQKIYDDRAEPMSNVVDVAICMLRRKIDRPGQPSAIRTRRGFGYTIRMDDERV
jgi:DNA-binding response OmpR family regulator